ncbi:hypothetical protein HAX54_043930 [Datura stramonium]|uniref:Uncharacterized protein n=1 Tax=Datura stramonium TaxID=4076 RepID=A0ABS8W1Z7_DATST|nr:hypothetical protein [Datura stramonium]
MKPAFIQNQLTLRRRRALRKFKKELSDSRLREGFNKAERIFRQQAFLPNRGDRPPYGRCDYQPKSGAGLNATLPIKSRFAPARDERGLTRALSHLIDSFLHWRFGFYNSILPFRRQSTRGTHLAFTYEEFNPLEEERGVGIVPEKSNPVDYKEKIESHPATAADSIADGLEKNLSFDLLIQLPDNQGSMREDRVSPCGKHYPGTIIQELEDGWRDTPKSPTINPQGFQASWSNL